MLTPLFLLLLFDALLTIFAQNSHNIVVDVTEYGINSYLSGMRYYFNNSLANWSPPNMGYSTCFCGIVLQNHTIAMLKIDEFKPELSDNFFNVTLNGVDLEISGNYDRNFLFFHTSNPYKARISTSHVSIGPLIPIAYSGLPFVYMNLTCDIQDFEIDETLTNGWLVTSLIENAIKSNFKNHLCHQLASILDERIREDISMLELHFPIIHDSANINYRIVKHPIQLASRAIRYYLDGTTTDSERFRADFRPPIVENSKRHLIYHIHDRLLSEVAQTLCDKGYFDSSKLEILLRLKSQIADETIDNSFNAALFARIADVLRSHYRLPLPLVLGASIADVMFESHSRFITVHTNLDFLVDIQQF
ncbi:unnamed protein product [Caenorhabditis bovis]|uniref:Lipid-binding serum glycoprotein C-terminal domain-containing protein n=1 Tax=Caenorhabditis bovis TaxID=2654633 RepID=A0A8S1ESV4_9PELO|nr:unnamed protein product [Caenorhabditis bovis]